MAYTVDPKILSICEKVTAKRPRAVIDRILEVGYVTTEDLQAMGYDHPPRAARDVRENGVPLETFKVRSDRTGRTIAAYRFADPSEIKDGRIGGRIAFSKQFRELLLSMYGSRDSITGVRLEGRYLQIDHRIPYEVAGDQSVSDLDPKNFMLLDASSQRSKSWSCEHCENWRNEKDAEVCRQCYWAFPESYRHVAMKPIRRIDIAWTGQETDVFDTVVKKANEIGMSPDQFIKNIISLALK